MRAVVLDRIGGPLEVRDVPDPVPPAGGVVVEVRATGLCRSDWHAWAGHDDIALPHVPGHELAGIVRAVGAGVSNWAAGDRVTVPFVEACGRCEWCRSGNAQVCPDQQQPGFTHWGSFAEYVALHAADTNLVAIPEPVSFEAAASLGCRFATAYRALTGRARLAAGEWVTVVGAGGVGLSTVMIARALGARVIAVDRNTGVLDAARSLGAEHVLLAAEGTGGIPDQVQEITGGGSHVAVDAVGSEQTCADSILSLRRRGRHVQVGLLPPVSGHPRVPMARVIGWELDLLGSHGMAAADYPRMLALIESGVLRPQDLVERIIGLHEAAALLPAFDKASPSGVTMINPRGERQAGLDCRPVRLGLLAMTTPMFRYCDEFVTRWAALDPVGIGGFLTEPFRPATDYSPGGHEAWADLMSGTLSALDSVPVTSERDRLAAAHLRERLEAQLAWHRAGEPLRDLRTPFGLVNEIRDSLDLLARDDDEDWRNIAARLRAVPEMFAGWQTSLDEGLSRGLPAARRQAVEGAVQADRYAAGTHDALVASYGDGPLAAELAEAAKAAHAGYAEVARYLRESYAPRAAEADAAGAERYVMAARLTLGAELDPREAYEWGWDELARIEAEMTAEANRVRQGATVEEAIAILDESVYVDGEDAYLGWLQERHARAIEALDGKAFDIAPPLRSLDVVLAKGSTSGAAYYTPPSEDLSRPGRTWWPLSSRERFQVWHELTTVFHEGVPGHHLQVGAATTAGDALSRYSKCTFVSGHGEGWALYAERLADELGWFDEPGTRLGMLAASATRAARVVIDIGVHLDLPLPDGSRWSFEKACEVLRERGRAAPSRVHAEVVRYFGWPGQAIAYKLGERAWLEARAEAARRPGFDLKRWHTAALSLGPIGLASLATELRAI